MIMSSVAVMTFGKRLVERLVQRFKVVDNSDFSPTRLTAWETLLILPL